MHLKVFLKLEKSQKLSLLGKYIKKTKKNKKKRKTPKKTKKTHWAGFFLKTRAFSNPSWRWGRSSACCSSTARSSRQRATWRRCAATSGLTSSTPASPLPPMSSPSGNNSLTRFQAHLVIKLRFFMLCGSAVDPYPDPGGQK
jgi:hypothetical protein